MLTKSVQSLYIEPIGNIILKRSIKSRYLRIRVSRNKDITVIVPENIPETLAIRFINDKKSWILKSLERLSKLKEKRTVFTETNFFQTRMHRLQIMKHDRNTLRSMISEGRIMVWYPEKADISDDRIQAFIRKAITEALRIEAKKYLPDRISFLANQSGYRYNHVTVKNTRTRWGSCSSKNNINLSLQLMRLPDHLIDYVILHELTHTQEKNHQKSFWLKLESVLPGARQIDKELNRFHMDW